MDLAEAVVKAVTSGKATSCTSRTLHALLIKPASEVHKDEESKGTSANLGRTSSRASRRAVGTTKASTKNVDKTSVFSVLDESTTSSAKAKQALATSVVNAGLKVLSQAVRTQSNLDQRNQTPQPKEIPREPTAANPSPTRSPARHGALQPRSGNSTPTRRSQKTALDSRKFSTASCGQARSEPGGGSTMTMAVAECTSHAFHYLLSLDPAPKDSQLERGMLAFCSKLIDLKFDQLAMKELRIVKRRLESRVAVPKCQRSSKTSVGVSTTSSSEKVTLSNLLEVSLGEADLDTLSLAVTYQLSVLKCIANQHKSATLDSSLQYLKVTNPGGPINTIKECAKLSGDASKAAQQLDVLSQLILGLCPGSSSSKDEDALESSRYPSPHTVLHLQSIALQIQIASEDLRSKKATSSHSPTVLLSKFLTTYLRRCRKCQGENDIYQDVKTVYQELSLSGNATPTSDGDKLALFKIRRNLCILADSANLLDEATRWAEGLIEIGEALDTDHALRAAAKSRRLTAWHRNGSDNDFSEGMNNELNELRLLLERPLTGLTSDLEIVITELSQFMDCIIRKSGPTISASQSELFGVAADFVARHDRSHPGVGGKHAVDIVDSAVSACRSTEDLASWVSKDVIRIIHRSRGVYEALELVSTQTISRLWSSSRSTLVLGRMLKGLMCKAVRSDPAASARLIFDDSSFDPEQRGALLEWQFMQAIGQCRKKQHQLSGRRVVAELLDRLNKLYAAEDHPLRRARVAMQVLRKAQEDSEFMSSSTVAIWRDCQSINGHQLGKDDGLSRYVTDANLSLQVAKAFMNGHPEPTSLSPLLTSWMELLKIPNDEDITQVIDDSADLLAQLKGLDDYFAMFGCHQERLQLVQVMLRICELSHQDSCGPILLLARVYLQIGHTDNARHTLRQAEDLLRSGNVSKLRSLQYQVCRSDYLLAIDDAVQCRESIREARGVCQEIQERDSSTTLSKKFQLLASQTHLIESKLQLAVGTPYDALIAAKEVAKTLNAIWQSSERPNKHDTPGPEESEFEDADKEIKGLAKGISKLNLKAKSASEESGSLDSKVKGVAFWPVIPLLCEAFSHLSTVLAHHGIFRDAMYCSNQAVKVADIGQFSRLSAHMLVHRGVLYTSAGNLEAAELDLTTATERVSSDRSLVKVGLLRAQAGLRLKEGFSDQASILFKEAERVLQSLQSETCSLTSDSSKSCKDTHVSEDQEVEITAKNDAPLRKEPRPRATVSKSNATRTHSKRAPKGTVSENVQDEQKRNSHVFRKTEAHIVLEQTLASFKVGGSVAAYIVQLQNLFDSLPGTSSQRQVEFHGMMRKVFTALQQDVSFNVLPESTLAVPALIKPTTEISQTKVSKLSTSSRSQKRPTKTAVTSSTKTRVVPVETLESLLSDAASCLMVQSGCIRTTAETHLEMAMVSSAAMLLSTTCLSSTNSLRLPIESALAIELPRINATECRSASARAEIELHGSKRLQGWNSVTENEIHPPLTAAEFQEQYIDILPRPWTAVSLSLSEDAQELYISRYRQGDSPLILRLPFARHKPDSEDDEPFDFGTGKAELQDIIELNNYTCHQPVDTKNKTSKEEWWSEREALDRRLEELLINIENIWLGGFKGIFSQHRSESSQLQQFRTAFEATLERHLPSRNGAKRDKDRLVISDAILELFPSLGINDEGEMDLDEALADLLYFIVDMLQFNGERNAYDEIDFDAMSVEVSDALDVYHRGIEEEDDNGKHTILVLDRRLQTFPWESLPCLNSVSVSRVDSVLTLRERILGMQTQLLQNRAGRGSADGVFTVPRESGSYILNPSGDLKHTEEGLAPMLSSLKDLQDSCWSAIVKRSPTEDEFKNVLDTSSTLLYFGHGAATQYIRPRAIRQLSRCSEVVWLMGCSSGSVTEYGDLEPSAVPYEYLVAGQSRKPPSHHDPLETEPTDSRRCMAVLAMLWDVTDKDIDRFSLAVGDEWGLWESSPSQCKLPAKTPRKREVVDIPSTPQRGLKTPKTPRVRNTPAPTRTPARSRSRPGRSRKQKSSLVDAVARSRDVCYLRYLNGAAPVVYGIPVYLEA